MEWGGASSIIQKSLKFLTPNVWNESSGENDLSYQGPCGFNAFSIVIPDQWCDGLYIIKFENEDKGLTSSVLVNIP